MYTGFENFENQGIENVRLLEQITQLLELDNDYVTEIQIEGRSIIATTQKGNIFQIKGIRMFIENVDNQLLLNFNIPEGNLHTGEGFNQYYFDINLWDIVLNQPNTLEGGYRIDDARIEFQSTKLVSNCTELQKANIGCKVPIKLFTDEKMFTDDDKVQYGLLILKIPEQIRRVSEVNYKHETLWYILGRTLRTLHDNKIFGAISHTGNISIEEDYLKFDISEIKEKYNNNEFPKILLHDLYLTNIVYNLNQNNNIISHKAHDIINVLLILSHILRLLLEYQINSNDAQIAIKYYSNNSIKTYFYTFIQGYFHDQQIDEEYLNNLLEIVINLVQVINVKIMKAISESKTNEDRPNEKFPELKSLLTCLEPLLRS
ncbi:MAG: hypothetical protein KatS3mg085_417 [Candidatus Dojkabacteria bacterium]|nr:MAG: hypothetical protein KatS3mg085_417 [Candidatus Dojkabacteria bacterium]